jgi:hypothetical protein
VAQILADTLEQRIADLEGTVRSLVAAAAVGGTSEAATTPGAVTLTGTASTVGGVGWNTTAGPNVDLFSVGGRFRVDVGASFEVYGNKCSLFAGFQVRGPVLDPGVEDLAAAPIVRAPSYEASASLQDDGVGMNQLGAFSTFDVVTGLEVGWYRVQTAYALSYSSTTGAPYGIATYRRLAVTRY